MSEKVVTREEVRATWDLEKLAEFIGAVDEKGEKWTLERLGYGYSESMDSGGALETAQGRAKATEKTLLRLLQSLLDKGLMTKKEVLEVICSY